MLWLKPYPLEGAAFLLLKRASSVKDLSRGRGDRKLKLHFFKSGKVSSLAWLLIL
jgi:hypothetical protein